ncbi:hypothetical protein MACA111363_11360 [Macrococcoides canis]|uniref:Uncharacterized protein n=1 Tax=Macrococcoides canis TaxID=1855823 RepID=A0A1W7ADS4_9STAP|nr:hypothetical protein [Macrococcus canis]ARQ07759.1 hypothetical protein MCCS_21700 [Macrococcus canis]
MNNIINIPSPSQQISEAVREALRVQASINYASIFSNITEVIKTVNANAFNINKITQSLNTYSKLAETLAIRQTIIANQLPSIVASLNKAINDVSIRTIISQSLVVPVDLPVVDSEDIEDIQNDYSDFIYQESKPSVYPLSLTEKLSLNIDTVLQSKAFDTTTVIYNSVVRFFFFKCLEDELPNATSTVLFLLTLDVIFNLYDSRQNKDTK